MCQILEICTNPYNHIHGCNCDKKLKPYYIVNPNIMPDMCQLCGKKLNDEGYCRNQNCFINTKRNTDNLL